MAMRYIVTSERHIIRKLQGPLRRLLTADDKAPRIELGRHFKTDERKATGVAFRDATLRPIGSRSHKFIDFMALRHTVLIRFHGTAQDLESFGLNVRSQAQDVYTVDGTLSELAEVARESATLSMQLPTPTEPNLDYATGQSGIAEVHQRCPFDLDGYTGQNVLVGIIDTPLDVTHPTFRNANGTRVLYLWTPAPSTIDNTGQTVRQDNPAGRTPEAYTQHDPSNRPDFTGLNDGRIYDRDDINAALDNQAGTFGTAERQICSEPGLERPMYHGTHVAGIAAGSSFHDQADPPFIGAAPDSDIIFAGAPGFGDADIMDAITFMLAIADHLQRPIVINISWGSHYFAHDGGSVFNQFVDNAVSSYHNRIVTLSAGNDNNQDIVRIGQVGSHMTRSLELTSTNHDAPQNLTVSIWSADRQLDVRLTVDGQSSAWCTADQIWNGPLAGHDARIDRFQQARKQGIRVTSSDMTPDTMLTIELRNATSQPVSYTAWKNSGKTAFADSTDITDTHTFNDLASTRSGIAVGAANRPRHIDPAEGERVASFSGAGPTLDGRIKPEIVTIGNPIMSAEPVDPEQLWFSRSGTSMSAPLAAGGIACLMQAAQDRGHRLDHVSVLGLLAQHANRAGLHLDPAEDDFSHADLNRYGYGRLRMVGAVY